MSLMCNFDKNIPKEGILNVWQQIQKPYGTRWFKLESSKLAISENMFLHICANYSCNG